MRDSYASDDFNFLCPERGRWITPTDDDVFWYGHSLPPDLQHRTYDARYLEWREKDMNELIDEAVGDRRTLSRTHRLLSDAVEFASVFGGELSHKEFKKTLLEYLAD